MATWNWQAALRFRGTPKERLSADILSRWLLEDEEEDGGDNWPFGGY